MNILINASNIKNGGGVQVADSTLRQLSNFSQHTFYVVSSDALQYLYKDAKHISNIVWFHYNLPISILGTLCGRNVFLDSLVKEHHIEKVFTIFGPSLWHPKVKHLCGFARPQIVYTDSPFFKKMNMKARLKSRLFERVKLYNFRKTADAWVTEDEEVTNRLKKKIGSQSIFTVTNCYNQVFEQTSEWISNIHLPTFDGITLLTISANHPHKNLSIITSVLEELENRDKLNHIRFVLTLNKEEIHIDSRYEKNICLVGHINISQCPHLYKQADIMFLPTLLECFSASYAEAMYMGVPVLTSDLPFAHSLCGNAAMFCDTLDAKSIADAILELHHNETLKSSLIENGKKRLKNFDNYQQRTQKYIRIVENL